jgi:LysM repeat protein
MDVRRSPLRALAPLALVAFSVTLLLIVANAGDDGGGASSGRSATQERTAETTERTRESTQTERERTRPAKYTVEPGDTLDQIAQENDTSTSRLLEINPNLDPQSLVAGQEICLQPSTDCGS